MENQDKKRFLSLGVALAAFLTLGGLGNIAIQEALYWIPFVANVVVYGWLMYKLVKPNKEK